VWPDAVTGCTWPPPTRWPIFHIDVIRGRDGMDPAGILPVFGGVAVHDCFAPYDHYEAITHQLCNAHLLRDLTAVAETGAKQDWAAYMGDLLRQVWVGSKPPKPKAATSWPAGSWLA
jgi:hypothetical protein